LYYSIELIRLISVILITFTHIRHNFTDGAMFVLLEQIPLYGTLILSIISGFLYSEITSKKGGLVKKKTRSLLIPYLIANIVVIIPVVIAHFFGIDVLNRLDVGIELITNGLFSISAAPVNPPTYFIRDLFIIFMIVEVLRSRNYYLLVGLIGLAFFGELLLRYDILILFLSGVVLSKVNGIHQEYFWWSVMITVLGAAVCFWFQIPFEKHVLSILFFILLINWKVGFMDVGGYSYTLHLYHSPVIVVLFPILYAFIPNPYLLVVAQLVCVFIFVSLIFLLIRKFKLNVMIGGR
tara:strand:+ start:30622 stop:31503 length:882 start_codon:yes stop_codon:yes gene_type:complete